MIYLLLFALIGLLLVNFLLSKGDIFAPTVMICVMYFICTLFSLYNYDFWELYTFSSKTVWLVMSSLLVFSAVGFLINNVWYGRLKKSRQALSIEERQGRIVQINKAALTMTIIFQSIIIFLCIIYILRIGSGIGGWTNILYEFKSLSATGEASLPTLVQQGVKIVTVLGYIYLFIFVNNTIMQGNVRGNIKCLVPVILHLVRSIVTGSRYNMLCVIAAGAYAFYILYQLRTGWRKTFRLKYLIWGIGGLSAVLVLFVLLRRAAGRIDNIDPVYYITMYASGSIKLLDSYLQDPIASSTIWGKETFSGINIFLANRGIDNVYDINLEFRFINGQNIGNVYGAIRRYYQDFGFSGAMGLVAVSSAVWNTIYAKLTYARNRNRELMLIVFMYMVNSLLIFPIDDKFYNILVTPSFVIYFVLFAVFYRRLVRKRKVRRFYA